MGKLVIFACMVIFGLVGATACHFSDPTKKFGWSNVVAVGIVSALMGLVFSVVTIFLIAGDDYRYELYEDRIPISSFKHTNDPEYFQLGIKTIYEYHAGFSGSVTRYDRYYFLEKNSNGAEQIDWVNVDSVKIYRDQVNDAYLATKGRTRVFKYEGEIHKQKESYPVTLELHLPKKLNIVEMSDKG